jgi:fucose permease
LKKHVVPNKSPEITSETSQSRLSLLILSYIGFVGLGLPDAVIGVAWPSIRDDFELPQSGLGLLTICGGMAYLASSFFAGRLTALLGTGWLLTLSTALVAASGFGYAVSPVWPLLLACAVLAGLGSGAIDAGLNALVASQFSARHVNWLHACYSLGATLGPLLMTAALVELGSWRSGYALLAGAMLGLTAVFLLGRGQMSHATDSAAGVSIEVASAPTTIRSVLRHPIVVLQMALFFLYTGLELTVGYWTFALLTESRGVRPGLAGTLVGCYFGAIGVGRVLCGLLVARVGADRLVRLATLVACIGAGLLAFGQPREVGFAGLVLLGFSLAPIYPCLMSRTPERLGYGVGMHAIGFQVSAAMLGGFLLPAAGGLLIARFGLGSVTLLALATAAVLWLLHEVLLLAWPAAHGATDYGAVADP